MKHQAGTSLIELLLVLLAVVIICSMSIPSLPFLKKIVAKAELEKLHALCLCLQNKAIAKQHEELLTLNQTNHSYQTEYTKEQLPAGIQFGINDHVLGPPSHPNQIIKQPITFSNNQIIFYPTGLLSAGSLYITDQSKKLFTYALTCPVASRGSIYLYNYSKNNWKPIS